MSVKKLREWNPLQEVVVVVVKMSGKRKICAKAQKSFKGGKYFVVLVVLSVSELFVASQNAFFLSKSYLFYTMMVIVKIVIL